MNRFGVCTVLLAAGLPLLGPARAVAQDSPKPGAVTPPDRVIRLPLEAGKLSVLALARALLTEYGYAGDQLRFPDVRVDVGGTKGTLLLEGISASLGRTARLAKTEHGKVLRITIDAARARVVRHRIKERFGRVLSVLAGRDVLARRYALQLPERIAADASVVLCVHGIDSTGAIFDDLRRHLATERRAAGLRRLPCGVFEYANDEAIDRVAEQLAKRLRIQAKRFPKRRFLLVAHSMGGLVARYVLETAALDPGNVTTLIMVGVPNHGSRLSRLRAGIDLFEFLRDHGDKPRILAPLFDGMGEAGWDLWPESPFLAALDRKERNPEVTYHSILGNAGIMTEEDLDGWRESILAKVRRMKKSEIYEPKVAAWLGDLDEIVIGKGDGAVSIARGHLDGVQEVVVPMTHLGMLRSAMLDRPRVGGKQTVFERIDAWLREATRPR